MDRMWRWDEGWLWEACRPSSRPQGAPFECFFRQCRWWTKRGVRGKHPQRPRGRRRQPKRAPPAAGMPPLPPPPTVWMPPSPPIGPRSPSSTGAMPPSSARCQGGWGPRTVRTQPQHELCPVGAPPVWWHGEAGTATPGHHHQRLPAGCIHPLGQRQRASRSFLGPSPRRRAEGPSREHFSHPDENIG